MALGLALVATVCVRVTHTAAAQNPFIASETRKSAPAKNPMAGYPKFLQPAMAKVAALQNTIKQRMVRLAREIKQHPLGGAFWSFMLLSFAYGVVHALGPGHGKIYTCSYFLSRPGTFKRVLLFGNLTMLAHVLSGTFLILFGAFVLKTSGAITLENSGALLERFSYGLLVCVGAFIAGKTIVEMRAGHGHSHDCPDTAELKSLLITALAVGIVPCPGAALILLFALTLGILAAGLWAMLCIAVGMALTTSLFAFGAIGFRRTFFFLAQGSNRALSGVFSALSLGGALCIASLGLILLLGSL